MLLAPSWSPELKTSMPRRSSRLTRNLHFFMFTMMPSSTKRRMASIVCAQTVYQSLPCVVESSKKDSMEKLGTVDRPLSTSIMYWKYMGAPTSPNIILSARKRPSWVTIPRRSLVRSETGMFMNPAFWSMLLNTEDPGKRSTTHLHAGIG